MSDPALTPGLRDALERFDRYLVSDDVERSELMAATDTESLEAFADAVGPLFDEINAVLDRLDALPTLSDEQQDLVSKLNDLGQAGVEARLDLDDRGQP
jgi:hypothetical protein